MNNHLQKEQQDQSLYRLRSARQKRRALITARDRQLIARSRERDALSRQQHEQPWIALDPPVMRGWKRYFVLREDVARSKDAPVYERILSKINTEKLSHRRDFKKKKRKGGKKIFVVRNQYLAALDAQGWMKAAFTTKEAAHFELRPVQTKWGRSYMAYVFTEPWRYALRVRPNLITKVRVPDAAIESRIAQLRHYFTGDRGGRLDTLLRGNTYHWYDRTMPTEELRARQRFRNTPLHQLLAED